MADKFTKEQRSEIMSKVRSEDTKPEMKVRKLLHGMGYRFRLHRHDLPAHAVDHLHAGRLRAFRVLIKERVNFALVPRTQHDEIDVICLGGFPVDVPLVVGHVDAPAEDSAYGFTLREQLVGAR